MPKWIWFREQTQPQKYATEQPNLIQFSLVYQDKCTKFGECARGRKKLI